MPQTIRKYWGPFNGRTTLNYNWPAIDHDSVVLITASEYDANRVRFIGAASFTVANICPHGPPYDPNHGVTFVVNIDWGSPINLVTDIVLLDNKPIETDTWTPPMPNGIGVRLQYQQSREWCWIAAALSINHFYHPDSTWTQCAVMTIIGQNINGYPADTSACPSAAAYGTHFGLGAILGDPYNQLAEYVLDGPDLGIYPSYLKSGGVSDPLKVTGNYNTTYGPGLTLAQLADEINAGRPIAVDITWASGTSSHVVIIAGIQDDNLLILDPANGTSVVRFGVFPSTYYGGATLDAYTFTHA
jgi:Papain-like cysteine protease AvrRpt2